MENWLEVDRVYDIIVSVQGHCNGKALEENLVGCGLIFQDQAATLAWCQCDLISEQKRMTHFSAVSHSVKKFCWFCSQS